MKRGTIFAIVFTVSWCVGIIWWLNPTHFYPTMEPIPGYDRQNITTHLYVGNTDTGPWQFFCDVPYGEEMWVGEVPAAKWFSGYCDLYGIKSNWSGPVYSGDAPALPPPEPIPPPPKSGKGWGKGGKQK